MENQQTRIGEGLPTSPGAATGKIVFIPDDAEVMADKREDVIPVRKETTPEDIHGMKSAQGVLTALGGMGKCCVSGCTAEQVDAKGKHLMVREQDAGGSQAGVGKRVLFSSDLLLDLRGVVLRFCLFVFSPPLSLSLSLYMWMITT